MAKFKVSALCALVFIASICCDLLRSAYLSCHRVTRVKPARSASRLTLRVGAAARIQPARRRLTSGCVCVSVCVSVCVGRGEPLFRESVIQ